MGLVSLSGTVVGWTVAWFVVENSMTKLNE
jgi:hypothetical protein